VADTPNIYCGADEFTRYGIRAEAIRGVEVSDLQAALAAQSRVIDGYLRSRYKLPLVAWGEDIKLACARLAVEQVLMIRGYNPARPGDQQVADLASATRRLLERIPTNQYTPDVTDSSSGASEGVSAPAGSAQVFSDQSRGFFADSRTTQAGPFQGRR
jgi:phage gp36-like protein